MGRQTHWEGQKLVVQLSPGWGPPTLCPVPPSHRCLMIDREPPWEGLVVSERVTSRWPFSGSAIKGRCLLFCPLSPLRAPMAAPSPSTPPSHGVFAPAPHFPAEVLEPDNEIRACFLRTGIRELGRACGSGPEHPAMGKQGAFLLGGRPWGPRPTGT